MAFKQKEFEQTGPSVIKRLRRMYHETWSRDWPHDDEYLGVLWREARAGNPGQNWPKLYDDTLLAMRENHEFEPAN